MWMGTLKAGRRLCSKHQKRAKKYAGSKAWPSTTDRTYIWGLISAFLWSVWALAAKPFFSRLACKPSLDVPMYVHTIHA